MTTYYVDDYYEVSGGVVKKYYTAGGQHIARPAQRRGAALAGEKRENAEDTDPQRYTKRFQANFVSFVDP